MATSSASNRVVALVDLDCFYCAVERALDPSLMGVPMAVVQYNPYQRSQDSSSIGGVVSLPAEPASARVAVRDGKVRLPAATNGSIIAVSYEARARGVTRFFRGKEAVAKCPEIVLVQVPTAHGKSDMGVYRSFGARTLKIIREVCGAGSLVEKASVDEMYLDITVPAKRLLATSASHAAVFGEARSAGTHVAGSAEAAEEAAMGKQPTGVLARSSFRAGHAGQVERHIDLASDAWWLRDAPEWPAEEAMLAAGATLIARARLAVTERLGFTCSAGVAANKLLAKLCGGLHKPNQQTLLPASAVHALLDPLPVDRLRGFGGKLGELLCKGRPELQLAGYATAGALRGAGPHAVAKVLRGEWSHAADVAAAACRLAAGEDHAPVEERALAKQVGSSKNFSGAARILETRAAVERWAAELADDIASRLVAEAEENARVPSALIVSVSTNDWASMRSKRCPLRGDTSTRSLAKEAMGLVAQLTSGRPSNRLGITMLGLTADGFQSLASAGGGGGGGGQGSALKRILCGYSLGEYME